MCSKIQDQTHPRCVVCSQSDIRGLHLQYTVANDGSVTADFQCDETFEGYPGILHGGVISSVLDGAMGQCIFARGQTAVTVEITTRFRQPVEIHKKTTVAAEITRISHPLYLLRAKLIQDGQIKATAKGKFYDQPQFAGVLEQLP